MEKEKFEKIETAAISKVVVDGIAVDYDQPALSVALLYISQLEGILGEFNPKVIKVLDKCAEEVKERGRKANEQV